MGKYSEDKTELTDEEKLSLRDLGRLKWFVGTMKVTDLMSIHGIWERAVSEFLWEFVLKYTGRSMEVHYDGQEFRVDDPSPSGADEGVIELLGRFNWPWSVLYRAEIPRWQIWCEDEWPDEFSVDAGGVQEESEINVRKSIDTGSEAD